MKKWKVILASVIALLVLVITPLTVMAQSPTTPAVTAAPAFHGSLAIVAPRAVRVNTALSLTVFLRADQTPVAGVHVWAVTKDNVDKLKADVKALRENTSIKAADKDFEPLAAAYGISLGTTDNNGKLSPTFKDPGNYVLAAFKKGYSPDFSVLAVRNGAQALAITAPKRALPNTPVDIMVHLRGSDAPVADAGVWAVTLENAQALKDKLTQAQTANPQASDFANILSANAKLIGKTGADGKLSYSFANEGRYALIAFKTDFRPALSGIVIATPNPTPAATTPVRPNTTATVTPTPGK
jgi:hypothetical protein